MKKQILLAAASSLLFAALSAQEYVASLNGAASSSIQHAVQNTYSNSEGPATLFAKSSGFAIVTFDENTGNFTHGSSRTLGAGNLKMTTACMAHAGRNSMVLTYDQSNVYYSYVSTSTCMPQYNIFSIPRTVGILSEIKPVDIVYDGAQYFYVVYSAKSTALLRPVVIFNQIDALTGSMTSLRILDHSMPQIDFYPSDIEYVDNLHIYIGGTCNNGTTTDFFLGTFTSNMLFPALITLSYSNANLKPASLRVEASGTSIWLAGDFYNTAGPSSPLFLVNLTDNGGGSYTTNYSKTHSYDMSRISSCDMKSGYLVVGSRSTSANAPMNFLFNTSTSSLTDISYYNTYGNNLVPLSIMSSQSVFFVMRDNSANTIYDIRTQTGTAFISCSFGVIDTEANITAPITTLVHPLKAEYPVKSYPANYGNSYTWTMGRACVTPMPQNPGDAAQARTGNAHLSPNPASDQINISAAEETEITSIEIYSVTGQQVQTVAAENAASVTVSTTSLENGIYLFVIRNADGSVENKNVVVQH